jgi:histidinol dehydrogenase
MAGRVVNAGSVFLGNFAPESAGDYASGTNHTLPTNGFAKSYSGVGIDSFVKKISFQELAHFRINVDTIKPRLSYRIQFALVQKRLCLQ